MTSDWKSVSANPPPLDTVVMTRVEDSNGIINEQPLKAYQREAGTRVMWFFPDGSMYVYYTPTHWRFM